MARRVLVSWCGTWFGVGLEKDELKGLTDHDGPKLELVDLVVTAIEDLGLGEVGGKVAIKTLEAAIDVNRGIGHLHRPPDFGEGIAAGGELGFAFLGVAFGRDGREVDRGFDAGCKLFGRVHGFGLVVVDRGAIIARAW